MSQTSGLQPPSRRNLIRKRTLLAAQALIDGTSSLDCIVRDLSDIGARLSFAAPTALPDTFDLLIPSTKSRYRAEVAWRRMTLIGVRLGQRS